MLRSLLFSTLFLLCCPTLFAADLDLNQALKEVVDSSPDLAVSRSRLTEAQWKEKEMFGEGYLPKLRANGNYLTDKKYQFINVNLNGAPVVFPSIFPNSQFNLMAELPLFDGFVSTNRYLSADKREQAAREQFDWDSFKTEMTVTLAYYEALGALLLRDVAMQNLKVLEEHKREVQLFKKSGVSTNYDVLRVEVQASNAATDLADAEDNIILRRQKLAEVMGHEKEERALVGELPVPRESILTEVKTPSDRHDLKSLKLETLAREHEESAFNSHWVPRFSLFANYNWYNNLSVGFNDWDLYRNSRQVGFLMTWDLFDGFSSYSRSKQAIEKKVQSEKKLRSLELASVKDVETWRRRFKSQCRIYQARMEDIRRSEESVRLAREGKRVGARTDSELLDAELDLYRSKAGAVRAQLGAIEALVELQLAEGRRYY